MWIRRKQSSSLLDDLDQGTAIPEISPHLNDPVSGNRLGSTTHDGVVDYALKLHPNR